ncbi:MAG: MBG domain-containing protein, partial [Flavipsychrobacter sp.]|nr:MBG domain-containing protein [Flavipsychrobacter sp.]
SMGVTLNFINNPTISTWNGNVSVNDTGNVNTTLSSLTRAVGENVGSYNITAAGFTALTGSAIGNYNAPTFGTANSPALTITKASITGALTTPAQSIVYGQNDPLLSSMGVTLSGLINNASINTWNGLVSVSDTSSNVNTTLASLTRAVGENVGSYNITAATFNALAGSSAGNYNVPTFTTANSPALTITKASLTGTLTTPAQSIVYGQNDPALSSMGVTLNFINNPTISTWNGNVSVNDTGNVNTTLASLTRAVGENVGSYNITAASFTALTGSAISNYNAPTFGTANSPALTITKANLTGTLTTPAQSIVYGQNDPLLSSMGVTLNFINNPTISTWNGNVSVNDTGNVNTTLSSLTRAV